MKRYRQFASVLISDFETATWSHPIHNHNHYELIYIKHGTGTHHINGQEIPYQPGNVFLLGPDEEHFFAIIESSRFIYLKFTDLYIHQPEHKQQHEMHELEYLIKCKELRSSRFDIDPSDSAIIDRIYDVISTLKANLNKNERLIWLQIMTLTNLLKRNLTQMVAGTDSSGRSMEAMYTYIHEHIYSPASLRAKVMSEFFNMSPDYLGPYFKKNTGIGLAQYIRQYRNSLIEKSMKSGHYTLKHVAAEFGLTDESHLKKTMKSKSK